MRHKVDTLYKNLVNYYSKKVGHSKTTNGKTLSTLGKKSFGTKFKGVYARDQIPCLKAHESCIFNLDTKDKPGSHWCAMYKHGKKYLIYDSFGRKVIKGKKYIYTGCDAEQKIKEENCGQRCLAWLEIVYTMGTRYARCV